MANLTKIGSDGQTNATWRDRIDASIDKINTEILDTNKIITINTDGTSTLNVAINDVTTFNRSTYSSYQETVQAAIDFIPKNLGGKSLTIQFADGTHEFDTGYTSPSNGLYFNYFANGHLLIQGNATTTTWTTAAGADATDCSTQEGIDESKLVILSDMSHTSGHIDYKGFINLFCNTAYVQIRGIEFNNKRENNSSAIFNRGSQAMIENCTFVGSNNSDYSKGIMSTLHSNSYIRFNTFSNHDYCMQAHEGGQVSARNNFAFSPFPEHYINSTMAGISSATGNVPHTTADAFQVNTGGTITLDDYNRGNEALLTSHVLNSNTEVIVDVDQTCTSVKPLNGFTSWDNLADCIKDCPKVLNSFELTFTFKDGTHTYNDILFEGFVGGDLKLKGESEYGTTFESDDARTFQFDDINAHLFIGQTNPLIFKAKGSNVRCLYITDCSSVEIEKCKFSRVDNEDNYTGTMGILAYRSSLYIEECMFDDLHNGIQVVHNSTCYVEDCENETLECTNYGNVSQYGSRLSIFGSSTKYIGGATADYRAEHSGMIVAHVIDSSTVSNSNAIIVNGNANA